MVLYNILFDITESTHKKLLRDSSAKMKILSLFTHLMTFFLHFEECYSLKSFDDFYLMNKMLRDFLN